MYISKHIHMYISKHICICFVPNSYITGQSIEKLNYKITLVKDTVIYKKSHLKNDPLL